MARRIDACHGIVWIVTQVFDVPEHMTLSVLRHRVAEIRAQTQVQTCDLFFGQAFQRNSAQQEKSSAMHQLLL